MTWVEVAEPCSRQIWRRTAAGACGNLVRPLPLCSHAEMIAHLAKRNLHLPALDEPAQHLNRVTGLISTEQDLRVEAAERVAHEDLVDRHDGHSTMMPDGRGGADLDVAFAIAIAARHADRRQGVTESTSTSAKFARRLENRGRRVCRKAPPLPCPMCRPCKTDQAVSNSLKATGTVTNRHVAWHSAILFLSARMNLRDGYSSLYACFKSSFRVFQKYLSSIDVGMQPSVSLASVMGDQT